MMIKRNNRIYLTYIDKISDIVYHKTQQGGKNMKDQSIKKLTTGKILVLMAIPLCIMLMIIVFQALYFWENHKISSALLISITNNGISNDSIALIKEFISSYNNQSISIGLDIIGTAISVWIGLNIYNIVKRSSIKELENIAIAAEQKIDKFTNDYKDFTIITLQNAYVSEDRINFFFVEKLIAYDEESHCLTYNITKRIVIIENLLKTINAHYIAGNTTIVHDFNRRLNDEFNILASEINQPRHHFNDKLTSLFDAFITCRKGDMLYYDGLAYRDENNLHGASIQLQNAVRLYNTVLETLKDEQSHLAQSYLHNVQGYIYFVLQTIESSKPKGERDEQRIKQHIQAAYKHSMIACKNITDAEPLTKYARIYRNYGVNIEHYGKLNNGCNTPLGSLVQAYEQYMKAFQIDSKDIKTLISISSCILKIFDKITEIDNDRTGAYKVLHQRNIFNQLTDQLNKIQLSSANELIHFAKNALQKAILIDGTNIAAHYHLIHVYMYLYLIYRQHGCYIDDGKAEIQNCEVLANNEFPIAFKYKARNFAYAVDDETLIEKYNF